MARGTPDNSNHSGETLGELLLLERMPIVKNAHRKRHMYKCLCSCGVICIKNWQDVKRLYVKSCGCLKRLRDRSQCLPTVDLIVTQQYGHYQRKAKKRGYEWSISKDYFGGLLFLPCHYCNRPPSNVRKSTHNKTRSKNHKREHFVDGRSRSGGQHPRLRGGERGALLQTLQSRQI